MSAHLSIRGASPELARRLRAKARETGRSLNSVVLQLLEEALGMSDRRARLKRYQTWDAEDGRAFESAVSSLRKVDAKAWE